MNEYIYAHVISNGPYISSTSTPSGMVRYHNSNFEIYDGNYWVSVAPPTVNISLSNDMISIINWAMTKMAEEKQIEQMANDHPAIKAAYEQFKKSAEQLKTTIVLSKE